MRIKDVLPAAHWCTPRCAAATGRCTALLLACLATALVLNSPARAQMIVGRVVGTDQLPLGGAFVALLDSAGRQRTAGLTDSTGTYRLTAAAAGIYRLRVERLGKETITSSAFNLAPSERYSLNLTLPDNAISLAALEVVGKSRCKLRPSEGEPAARAWEEVRKALRVSAWSRTHSGLSYRTRRRQRVFEEPSRQVRLDTVVEASALALRSYGSLPPEQLARGGYVRRAPDGSFEYYAPDEVVLASDEFLDTHCMELVAPSRSGTLKLRFRPVRASGPSDIEGTALIDVVSGELRAVDFHYVHVGAALPIDSAGGRVEFAHLPSGVWFVSRWRLTFPEFALAPRRNLWAGGAVVVAALHETSGEVVGVAQGDDPKPLYGIAQDARPPALPPEQAAHTVVIAHVLDDSTGAQLAGAQVALAGSGKAAFTDESGYARLEGVEAGGVHAAVTMLGYATEEVDTSAAGGVLRLRDIRLRHQPVALRPVEVSVSSPRRDPRLAGTGYYDRQRRSGGSATFIAGSDLEKVSIRSNRFTDLLQGVPGVRVARNARGTGLIVLSTRRAISDFGNVQCYPQVYLDGVNTRYFDVSRGRVEQERADLNSIISLAEVMAVEVYPGEPSPPEYDKNPCGIVLVWTKRGPDR